MVLYVSPSIVKLFLECAREAWLSVHHWFRPITSSMRLGLRAHSVVDVEVLRRRIGFSDYVVGLHVCSRRLRLCGVLDFAVRVDGCWAPLEYKHQSLVGFPEKIQTTLYALLLEEYFGEPVTRAYIVLPRRTYRLKITGGLRRRALHVLDSTLRVLEESTPPRPRRTSLCATCPYKSFCWL